jgi:hypothetical protein
MTEEARENLIAVTMEQFLAASSPDPLSLRKLAAEIQALPLVQDMGGCYAIRCNGDIVSFAWDSPDQIDREEDPRIRNMAIFQGSRKYPALRALIPPRPAIARTCPQCQGRGELPVPMTRVICYCGGLGWLPE